MDTPNIVKAQENRLRRAARRQGLILHKCRSRDPRALGYGTFGLLRPIGARRTVLVAGDRTTGYGLSLEQVEGYLSGSEGP